MIHPWKCDAETGKMSDKNLEVSPVKGMAAVSHKQQWDLCPGPVLKVKPQQLPDLWDHAKNILTSEHGAPRPWGGTCFCLRVWEPGCLGNWPVWEATSYLSSWEPLGALDDAFRQCCPIFHVPFADECVCMWGWGWFPELGSILVSSCLLAESHSLLSRDWGCTCG